MGFPSLLMLLAALSRLMMAGPIPREDHRRFFASYPNISSTSTTASGLSMFDKASVSGHNIVQADTAIIVEPIQHTVLTNVIPAITFLNPQGQPLATGDPQTILSTSFITPTPALSLSIPSSTSTAPQGLSLLQTLSIASTLSTKPTAAIENTTVIAPSHNVPLFTYSPNAGETLASSRLNVGPSAQFSLTQPSSLSRFVTVTGVMTNSLTTRATSLSSSTVQAAPLSTLGNTTLHASPASGAIASETLTRVVVTKTEYTTVLESTRSRDAVSLMPTQPTMKSTVASMSISYQGMTSSRYKSSPEPLTSTLPPSLPVTSLPLPPLVIVTQYTTIIKTSTPTETAKLPSHSSVVKASTFTSILSSAYIVSSASQSVLVPSTGSAPTSPATVTSSTNTTVAPSDSSSMGLAPAPSFHSPSSSSPEMTSSPTATSELRSSSTSEGLLIITPIPPSQIFTVTVTTTERETIRETMTVTVTT